MIRILSSRQSFSKCLIFANFEDTDSIDFEIGIFPHQSGQNKVSDFFECLKFFKWETSHLQIGQNEVFDILGSLKLIKTRILTLFHLFNFHKFERTV